MQSVAEGRRSERESVLVSSQGLDIGAQSPASQLQGPRLPYAYVREMTGRRVGCGGLARHVFVPSHLQFWHASCKLY